jgi:hypothetical protein
MRAISFFLVGLVTFLSSETCWADELKNSQAIVPQQQFETDCSAAQSIADRGWQIFVAKNQLGDESDNIGIRANAFMILSSRCRKDAKNAKIEIDNTPLSETDLDIFKIFQPNGSMSALAACLFRSTPKAALKFVLSSDAAAFIKLQSSLKSGEISLGDTDQDALIQMLKSSSGCGDLIPRPPKEINANKLYSDLNWYVRVQPNLEVIMTWHRNRGAK